MAAQIKLAVQSVATHAAHVCDLQCVVWCTKPTRRTAAHNKHPKQGVTVQMGGGVHLIQELCDDVLSVAGRKVLAEFV